MSPDRKIVWEVFDNNPKEEAKVWNSFLGSGTLTDRQAK